MESDKVMAVFGQTTCQKCGAPLGADSRQGFCPQCLFAEAGLEDSEGVSISGEPHSTAGAVPSSHLSKTLSPWVLEGELCPCAFGDFELLKEVARGGMGIVYRARQVSLDRTVAVKMLLFGPLSSPEFVKRFRAEAAAAASLQHPNIVAIHEVGVHHGQHYFAMDYVEGPGLAKLLAAGPVPAKRAATYLKTIAEAIHYAHERGILHRDLKPSNVLIDANDQPRITDFGLARRLEGESELTVTGQVIGSPNYMPPEQAAGRRRKLSRRSDIYSLGAMLYHLLTGRPPFVGEALADTLEQVLNVEPVSPRLLNPSVPRDLETVCLKCLEKEPDKRYPTAQAVADELSRFLLNEPIHARPITRVERLWRWCRRKPALAISLAAAHLLLLALLIGGPALTYRINQALKRAEAGELAARHNQYASDMFRAHQELDQGDLFSVWQLLDRNRPAQIPSPKEIQSQSSVDLRGWEWRYLWQQCQGEELFILGYHTNGARTVGFLPDGKTVYSAGKDNAVRLWNLESRQPIGLLAHEYPVTGVDCSPDGHWMVTSSDSGATENDPLILWDLATRRKAAVLTTNFWLRPKSVLFSPDSQLLAFVAHYDGIRLWNMASLQEVTNIKADFRNTTALGLAFSPDGQTLAYNENLDGNIALYDIPTRRTREQRLKGHTWFVPMLTFTPNGRILVSGGTDRTIRLWDVAQGRQQAVFTNYAEGVANLRMSRDGSKLVFAATAGLQQLTLQETLTGKVLNTFRGHTKPLSDAKFSPDGRVLISSSWDGTVRVWDATRRLQEHDRIYLQKGVHDLAFGSGAALFLSPSGHHLLVVFTDNTFSLYDVCSLSEIAHDRLPASEFACGAMAPDGKRVAFVAMDGNVVIWHADTRQTDLFARPLTNSCNRAVFSTDGTRLALADNGGEVCVMDAATGTDLHRFHYSVKSENIAMSLAFSRNGQTLMAGFYSGLIKVWDLTGQRPEVPLKGHTEQVRALALLPDGRTLVSGSPDGSIRFWDLASGTPRRVVKPRVTGFFGYSVSPDGRRMAIACADRSITIWDLVSGQELVTFPEHKGRVDDVCFLPDGNTLVSVGVDQLRVWRAPSFEEIARTEKAQPRRE
jgi:WD40 repeat protein/serine/threonine protein kinase